MISHQRCALESWTWIPFYGFFRFTLKSVLRGLWPGRGNSGKSSSCKSSKNSNPLPSGESHPGAEIVTRLNALLMRLPFFSDYLRPVFTYTLFTISWLQTSHFVDLPPQTLWYYVLSSRLYPPSTVETWRRNSKKLTNFVIRSFQLHWRTNMSF